MAHHYTPQEAAFIRDNVKGTGNQDLTDLFNAHFKTDLNIRQIKAWKKNHKLDSGLTGRFNPDHVPFNKGRKGIFLGGESGEAAQFPKGHKSWNWVPVGSERVNADGYVDIKVDDGKLQKNWKAKHVMLWEAANGPVPKSHAVIFGDRNKSNFDLENLVLVSRKQLVRLNQNHLIQGNTELTKIGIVIADIYNKIATVKREK